MAAFVVVSENVTVPPSTGLPDRSVTVAVSTSGVAQSEAGTEGDWLGATVKVVSVATWAASGRAPARIASRAAHG